MARKCCYGPGVVLRRPRAVIGWTVISSFPVSCRCWRCVSDLGLVHDQVLAGCVVFYVI